MLVKGGTEHMMTSWHGDAFRITGLRDGMTGGFRSQKASTFWNSICSQSKQIFQGAVQLPVILDAMVLIWRHCKDYWMQIYKQETRTFQNATISTEIKLWI